MRISIALPIAAALAPRVGTFVSARKSLSVISMTLAGAVATWTPAEATLKAERACVAKAAACKIGCSKKWVTVEFQRSCESRCGVDFNKCLAAASPMPNNAPTDPQKAPPKATVNHTPAGGGIKGEPKAPPKVNGTRAPLGGVLGQSTTSGSGAGGTILKSASGRR